MRWLSAMVLVAVANLGWAAAPPGKTRDLTAAEQKEIDTLVAGLSKHVNAGAFEQSAKLDPRASEPLRAQAPILLMLDRPRDALTQIEAALKLDPDDHMTWFFAARLHWCDNEFSVGSDGIMRKPS